MLFAMEINLISVQTYLVGLYAGLKIKRERGRDHNFVSICALQWKSSLLKQTYLVGE